MQDFHKGDAFSAVWGTEVPQRGPGAEPRWGLGAKPPEARDIMLNSRLITSENFNIKKQSTRQKHDNLAQEVKLVWSSQSELVNDRQVRLASFAHVRGSAPMMSAAHLPLTTEGVFSRLRVEKERSGVVVVTGKVTSTCSRMDRFVYRDALHAVYAFSAVLGGSAAACQRCFHSSNSARSLL